MRNKESKNNFSNNSDFESAFSTITKIAGLIIIIIVYSCDPVFKTTVKNDSNTDITIEIQYDKEELKKYWGDRPYIPILAGEVREGGTLISFDTIDLKAMIKLKENETFTIEGGMGGGPDFELIKKISVFYYDTLILNNKESMHQSFKEFETRQFELKIKNVAQ